MKELSNDLFHPRNAQKPCRWLSHALSDPKTKENWQQSFTKTLSARFEQGLLPLVADLLGLGLLGGVDELFDESLSGSFGEISNGKPVCMFSRHSSVSSI
jgi:hypothetical protein